MQRLGRVKEVAQEVVGTRAGPGNFGKHYAVMVIRARGASPSRIACEEYEIDFRCTSIQPFWFDRRW